MAFRFRRRLNLGRGLTLNVGKRGASVRLGGRGAGITAGSSGTRATLGGMGTGAFYTKKLGKGGRRVSQGGGSGLGGAIAFVAILVVLYALTF